MSKVFPMRGAARVALAGVALLVAAVAFPSEAAAKKRVGVSLNGTPAGPIRAAVAVVLKHHDFEPMVPDLSGDSEDAIAAAARQSKLSAVIVGEVRDGGKRVKLRVYDGGGDLIGEGSWTEKGGPKKLAAAVERTLWGRVGGALSKAREGGGKGGGPNKGDKAEKPEKAERAEKTVAQKEEPEPAHSKTPVDETPTYSRSSDSEASAKDEDGETAKKFKKKKKAAPSEEAEVVESEGGGSSTGAAGTALDLSVGPRFLTRSLSWVNDPMGNLRSYSLGLAPSVGAQLAWFPAAHVTGGMASNLGIAGSVEYTPGLVSQTSTGARYPTQESDFWGGGRFRLVLGPVAAAATVGYGQHAFVFRSGSNATSARANLNDLPDVKYSYLRGAANLRVDLPANLALMLGGGYRYVLSAGSTNYLVGAMGFLPNVTAFGIDADAALGYRIASVLEARVGFDLRRYIMSAHMNTFGINGGVDQYIAFWVQAAVVLDGAGKKAGGAGGDDEEEAAPAHKKRKPAKEKDKDAEEAGDSGGDE